MYVLIPQSAEEKHKITCIEEKTALANYIGVHRNTLAYRYNKANEEGKNYIETSKYIIYKAEYFIGKTRKTGFTSTARSNKEYE